MIAAVFYTSIWWLCGIVAVCLMDRLDETPRKREEAGLLLLAALGPVLLVLEIMSIICDD